MPKLSEEKKLEKENNSEDHQVKNRTPSKVPYWINQFFKEKEMQWLGTLKNRKCKGCGFVVCTAIANFSKHSSIMGVLFCNHHESHFAVGFSFSLLLMQLLVCSPEPFSLDMHHKSVWKCVTRRKKQSSQNQRKTQLCEIWNQKWRNHLPEIWNLLASWQMTKQVI